MAVNLSEVNNNFSVIYEGDAGSRVFSTSLNETIMTLLLIHASGMQSRLYMNGTKAILKSS